MSITGNSRTLRNLIVVPRRDLSLEFANTVAWRGSAPTESLHNLQDVLAWLASAKALPGRAVAELGKWFDAHPADAAMVFGEAIETRETLYRLLHAAASGSAPANEDLRRLNGALGEAAPRANLDRAGRGFGWRIEARPSAAGILASVLWSAADILVGPDCARVRQCANERCLWLFLDDSKNGTRRWCSMQACGNRAKAHRHYLRHKGK
ncbi:MAG: ABATE domain-containing protein [Candidatus Binataceae bacterium]